MPTREEMMELVEAHAALDDPMETAIWIHQGDREVAWLVEVIPSMRPDSHPERPVAFAAGHDFRYPLRLIGVNSTDIREALRRDLDLARAVASGEVMYGADSGKELIEFAGELVSHGNALAS